MPTIQDLIKDEQEAITGYRAFLAQEPHSKIIIFKIHKIIEQEENHIKILRKIK